MNVVFADPKPAPLAPHPWDRFGKPPRPGYAYHVAAEMELLIEPALRAARNLTDADYERREAERHEEAADDYEREARIDLDKLPEKLADSIRDDPELFVGPDDVLREAARVAA